MKSVCFLLLFLTCFVCRANDLTMFSLTGPVDSVCIVHDDAGLEWQIEYSFDSDGFLIEIDGEEPECERNKQHRISTITLIDSEEDDEESFTTIQMKLFYDNSGRVIKTESKSGDEQWIQNYFYDSKGLLKERDYDISGEKEVQTYTYLKFDEYGNWTERLEKLKSMDQTIRQTRYITYRK